MATGLSSIGKVSGTKYGRLTVIDVVGRSPYGPAIWRCQCDCGTIKDVSSHGLRRGTTVSCGCFKREDTVSRFTTHGQAGKVRSHEYNIWSSMINRCHRPKAIGYRNYGGRGIYVCDRWRRSFESFFADMGPRPTAAHSIERTDNDGPYDPDNCVWALRKRQQLNTRRTVFVKLFGMDVPLAVALNASGANRSTFAHRRAKGLSVEDALGVPLTDDLRARIVADLSPE